MKVETDPEIIEAYLNFLSRKDFPCVAAREAVVRQQVSCLVAGHMACPNDDAAILHFLYSFVDAYRKRNALFHSAAVIFRQPLIPDEQLFDTWMWQRLQALADKDAARYNYDGRVASDPSSEHFSFSIKEEAFFIVGLHPQSSRAMRRFRYAALAFNPHAQFETMKETEQYSKLKNIVRKRDLAYSGSINPMLDDFGKSSEVYQYSGRRYGNEWQCPLKINHAAVNHHSAPERDRLFVEGRPAS